MGRTSVLSTNASILPILLPPSTLRPVAFRTFTRKHNLTISSTALELLANFVGRNCGSGWREDGLAERVLDEVAKMWKKAGGGVIVEDCTGVSLKTILQAVEGSMSGGRLIAKEIAIRDVPRGQGGHDILDKTVSTSKLVTAIPADDEETEDPVTSRDPRNWMKIIDAFDQPRLVYNAKQKHFEAPTSKSSVFPHSSHKAAMFRDRYNLVYQRLLRNEAFEVTTLEGSLGTSFRSSSLMNAQKAYKLTPIANLLGRSGTSHLLLGLLSLSPTGELSLTDLTGSILLDLTHATAVPENGAWYGPGMVLLVDGIYEEFEGAKGSTLGGNNGVGGRVGGKFVGISIGGPPCERREVTLGRSTHNSNGDHGGFGWVDFLGVGSERAQGPRMRRIETRCLRQGPSANQHSSRRTMVVMGEVNLDNPKSIEALKMVIQFYSDLPLTELPMAFFLIGNFVQNAMTSGGLVNSIEYKELFDILASILAGYPSVLQHSTLVFVPGDNDPWASLFSGGAATPLPHRSIPDLFTSRVKRAFSSANNDSEASGLAGDVIFTSNPSRLCLFGPIYEIAVLRDDIAGRLRRNSVVPGTDNDKSQQERQHRDGDAPITDEEQSESLVPGDNQEECFEDENYLAITSARKLVKTVLDQGTMSPFPLNSRPVLWDYASSLQLFPLPTAFILVDTESPPFAITYEGCHVMNPGRLLSESRRGVARWIEYDVFRNRGKVKEERY
ncbi:hypothetical protein Egran_03828 [Elaphomyces granulatus]|uniref:DNA polymerase epsilon subunit B n=1 Tax=Elaphomyces granulatus TaxID=519963 RepID=A0A232LWL3_9EURO|nr:hypothetical protein Egran_03828 [Elaphomyces granulatus]